MSINSTNWSPGSINSTNYTESEPVTGSITLSAGSPMGLALVLTYAEDTTVTFRQYPEDYTSESINSTNWS